MTWVKVILDRSGQFISVRPPNLIINRSSQGNKANFANGSRVKGQKHYANKGGAAGDQPPSIITTRFRNSAKFNVLRPGDIVLTELSKTQHSVYSVSRGSCFAHD
eukprot:m.42400 g.42400  ORF g.42400 m.42400 type:complete len:105 (-) comp10511_c0_seq2:246-560(-)